ncbi:MAG TPA: DUF72 domain-containing protein [Polyangiaceae bacterium]|nr:DUF72 domain-containing protein [Polyangiaceae bacterium]
MPVWIGTSGFSYKEWKKNFYPPDLSEKRFLSYYATRFNGVEIDSTFYRMPAPKALDAWKESTPEAFRFAIKASQRITHFGRLALPSESLDYFLSVLPKLESRLGIVLYQLPPSFKQDLPRLEAFIAALPKGTKAAFEFRHLSWFNDETLRALERGGVALCVNDNDEFECPVEITAPYTYVRLRREAYPAEKRTAWRERFKNFAERGIEVFAFIKHKDNPDAPLIALEFAEGIARPSL